MKRKVPDADRHRPSVCRCGSVRHHTPPHRNTAVAASASTALYDRTALIRDSTSSLQGPLPASGSGDSAVLLQELDEVPPAMVVAVQRCLAMYSFHSDES